MSSIQPAQHKSPLVPSLFKTIRSGYSLGMLSKDVSAGITVGVVALLFFMHGAKLSRQAVLAGIGHWRLHLLVVGSTFALFPLLGLALRPVLQPLVTPELYVGVLFLCVLPATVQSAIAFTAVAGGNMAAAVCSASASTLLGIFIYPALYYLVGHIGGFERRRTRSKQEEQA